MKFNFEIVIEFLFEISICVGVRFVLFNLLENIKIEISDQNSAVCRNRALLRIEKMQTVTVNGENSVEMVSGFVRLKNDHSIMLLSCICLFSTQYFHRFLVILV